MTVEQKWVYIYMLILWDTHLFLMGGEILFLMVGFSNYFYGDTLNLSDVTKGFKDSWGHSIH